jgi:hypothetical protein
MAILYKSSKKQITNAEYLQLVEMKALADSYYQKINDIERIAVEITGELDHEGNIETCGHTSDFLAGSRDLDGMLRILKLKVVK